MLTFFEVTGISFWVICALLGLVVIITKIVE